jgi:hypothetical protein
MLFAWQFATSSSEMGRDASEMSVSPSQNSSKPSPVPGPSTVTDVELPASSNSSATRLEIGSTAAARGHEQAERHEGCQEPEFPAAV